MTFEQMTYFLSLAKTLSFTKTAASTFTTQPTVSRQIQQLEKEVGCKLFFRKGNSITLTPPGHELYEHLSVISNLLSNALTLIKEGADSFQGNIYIGCSFSLNLDDYLVDCYHQFHQQYPLIGFNYEKNSVEGLEKGLINNKYDIIVITDSSANKYNEYEFRTLFEYSGVIAFSKKLIRSNNTESAINDLSELPVICLNDRYSPRKLSGIKKIARQAGLNYTSLIEVPNLETLLFYVKAGIGIAILDTSVIDPSDSLISTLPVNSSNASIFARAVWKKENVNPAIMPFVSILMDQVI